MKIEDANYIISQYEKYLDSSCTCFQGHAPCSYCEECPTKELYLEALDFIHDLRDKEIIDSL